MTDDSSERELNADEVKIHSRVVQTDQEGHPNVAGDVSNSTEVRTSHKTPWHELRWKFDKSNNRSLESVVRHFEDYLDCILAFSADSPLRRITASPHKLVSHRCPGYLREEITLTADVSRSVVVAHQYPSQSEICTICGQLVQYPSNPVPLVADNPFMHLTPSPEDPTAVHGFEGSGLFSPLLEYDADWSIATPETQTVNIQRWQSIPIPDAQHGRSSVAKYASWSVLRMTVMRVNKAERQQQEMAIEWHHASPGMLGPFKLTEDKRSQLQDWASWICEF